VGSAALPVVPCRGAVRDPEGRVPRRRAGPLRCRRGRRLPRLRQHLVRPPEAVLRREGMVEHHRLGRRAGAAHRPGDPHARRRSLSVHGHGRRSGHGAGWDRDRQRRDVQQGPCRCLFRHPGRRGGGSILRWGGAAAYRMHLVRQVQHRLRPQRQEQADDQLPLPGREARRGGPRAARGLRPRPARERRLRGAYASSRLGATSCASAPPHLHRRAGDRRRPRLRFGEAPSSHAAQGPPDRSVERARATSADEFGTAPRDHADARRVGARSGEDPPDAGVGVDHLRRVAG
jgi:hypothetical protein